MKVTYLRYLRSDEWREKRRLVLERDGYRCQLWLQHVATEVHHKSYAHLGHESLEDLISLCRACHKAITAVFRQERHRARAFRLKNVSRVTPALVRLDEASEIRTTNSVRTTPINERTSYGIPVIEVSNYRRITLLLHSGALVDPMNHFAKEMRKSQRSGIRPKRILNSSHGWSGMADCTCMRANPVYQGRCWKRRSPRGRNGRSGACKPRPGSCVARITP
jgi:hypothetical protein